jgi:RNA-binding motif protein, X-linked 2
MNSIRQTQALNKRELEAAVPPSASWHADYRDTAYVYIGGFPFDLSEGDLVTIFSQYGNPTHLNLIRDRETGKSKGFAFLKYEDQRSCDLAVDNLGGAEVLGRLLRVDHTRYKKKDGEDEETWRVDRLEGEEGAGKNGNGKRSSDGEDTAAHDNNVGGARTKRRKRSMIKEERELEELLQIREGDEEDPMRHYLIEEKKQEVGRALAKIERKDKHRHKHHPDKARDQYPDRDQHRAHASHSHRDDDDDDAADKDRRRRHHHHRHHPRHDDEDRDRRSRRKDGDGGETHRHHRHQRATSDDEASRSRSRSRSRRRRDTPSPHRVRARQARPAERYLKSDGPSTPSRSPSPSRSRERRPNRR